MKGTVAIQAIHLQEQSNHGKDWFDEDKLQYSSPAPQQEAPVRYLVRREKDS